MKTELKVKYLQHLNNKRREGGFTWIELLVIAIVVGLLAAVAVPSILTQANKSKQVEARNNVGAMNRAQQAYNLNKPGFASDLGSLGVGIPSQTTNYHYRIEGGGADATDVRNIASPQKTKLKGYQGYTFTVDVETDGVTEQVTLAIVCEAGLPGEEAPDASPGDDGLGACDPGDALLCGGCSESGIEQPVIAQQVSLANASNNLKFAAAVAEFGMVLRDSQYKGSASFEEVLKLAKESKGVDLEGYRAEFIRLVETAEAIAPKKP